jgi:casein kinase 1
MRSWSSLTLIRALSCPHPVPGIDIRTNERIAIKVENRSTKYPQLLDEYAVYRAVAKGIGVPSAIWCGSNTNVHIMVMDLLGDSLETLYNNCGRKFSLKTITMLAIQLLHRIEHHHNHHYLHRDIKPDNFLMGPPQSTNAHILYMVDMGQEHTTAGTSSNTPLKCGLTLSCCFSCCLSGLCKKYRDDTNLNHIPYRENKKLIGTPRYASM